MMGLRPNDEDQLHRDGMRIISEGRDATAFACQESEMSATGAQLREYRHGTNWQGANHFIRSSFGVLLLAGKLGTFLTQARLSSGASLRIVQWLIGMNALMLRTRHA